MTSGTVIKGSHCPKCNEPLEYNGNYWCSTRDAGLCDYVMSDYEYMTSKEKHAFNVAYVLLMQQTGREPRPEAIILDKTGKPW